MDIPISRKNNFSGVTTNHEVTMDNVVKLTRNLSIEHACFNGTVFARQCNIVQLMRNEITEQNSEGNLLYRVETMEFSGEYNKVELRSLHSYQAGLNYLNGTNGFPQNLKAAISELTISSHLGNLTAAYKLATMNEELQNEFLFYPKAQELWDRATQLGDETAKTFLACLAQAGVDYHGKTMQPENYFLVNQHDAY